jgi:hypothetical protein
VGRSIDASSMYQGSEGQEDRFEDVDPIVADVPVTEILRRDMEANPCAQIDNVPSDFSGDEEMPGLQRRVEDFRDGRTRRRRTRRGQSSFVKPFVTRGISCETE